MLESVVLPEEALDERMHRGGLAVPHVGDRPRLNKPPLIYWAQSLSAYVCTLGDPRRDAIWMYRLPSTLAAIGSVLVAWRLGLAMAARTRYRWAAWWAAATLAISPMVVWDAHQARADQLLLLCTTLAMWALWLIYDRVRAGERAPLWASVGLWAAIAAGVLTKGPITPMVAGLALASLVISHPARRWWGGLRPMLGLVVLAVSITPWLLAIEGRYGLARYAEIVYDEVVVRSASAKEGHWGPPGYHLVFLAALLWPVSLVTARAAFRAGRRVVARVRQRGRVSIDPATLFLVAWILPPWIVFELVSTKLPHYPLPLYPAVALLTARLVPGLDRLARVRGRAFLLRDPGFWLWCFIGVCLCAAPPLILVAHSASQNAAIPVVLLGISSVPVILWVFLLVRLSRDRGGTGLRPVPVIAGGAICLVSALALLLQFVVPRVVSVSRDVAEADAFASVIDRESPRPVGAVGYHEDSLVFWTRGRLERLGDDAGSAWLHANPDGLLLVEDRFVDRITHPVRSLGAVSGFNYSNGRPVTVHLLELDS
ncbi:MAG: glycosyltransferase family 39 protein [Planctomycetota bacterium]